MTTEQIKTEIARRGYRMEVWKDDSSRPWHAIVDTANVIVHAFNEPNEHAVLVAVVESFDFRFTEQPL